MASSSNTSRFATSFIALLMLQVTFNPFIVGNAQSRNSLLGGILTPVVAGVTPVVGSVVGGVTQVVSGVAPVVGGIVGLPGLLTVLGQVCCPGSGPTCPGSGIGNITVFLSCRNLLGNGNGTITLLGPTLTNVTGFFEITLPIQVAQDFLSSPSLSGIPPVLSCNITTSPLPLNSITCPISGIISTTTIVLNSSLQFVGTNLGALVNGILVALIEFTLSGVISIAA